MRPHSQSGSVALVALCCVAVLGIALASYLAVSNQSMKLSNRGYAADVSRHMAEMGLERAIRGFSFNVFSGGWTLSGNTAKRTIPITSSNYGNSGITGTINIRVDNYRDTANNKAVVWSARTTYAVGAYVWYQGVWYLCISAPPSKQDPSNTTYWTAAPAPWCGSTNYRPGNIAILGGNAYRCKAGGANVNQTPPNTTYWTSYAASNWSSATTYNIDDVVFSGGVAYRCLASSSNNAPPHTTYWLSEPVIYSEGVATLPDSTGTIIKTQLRALVAPAPLFPNALGATTLVTLSSTGTVDSYNQPLAGAYNAGTTYAPGDVARSGTTYYRCISTSTGNAPPNATYWTAAPLGYSAVIAGGNTAGTAVSVTSAVMGGYVAAPSTTTAPYAPQASFGAGASVPSLINSDGSVTSPHPSASKVDLTRISRSPYIPQFDIQSISTGTSLPASLGNGTRLFQGPLSLGTPGATTPTIYNITATYDTGLTGGISTSGSPGTAYPGLDLYEPNHDLTIVGPVILNVTGLFNIYQGSITIASGGSLEIYFTGILDIGYPTAVATAGIDNNTDDPTKVLIVGTSVTNTVNNHYVRTRRPFCGLIYMPNAYLTMTNSFTNHLYGAFSASNIKFTNTVNFHYDTSLRTAGAIGTFIDGPYMITEWRELTDPAEKVTLP
jgi:hypothetical protein